jgi:hypothetical protein
MVLLVVQLAKPSDLEWKIVVVVVRLNLLRPADFAGLLCNLTTLEGLKCSLPSRFFGLDCLVILAPVITHPLR